MKYKGILIKNSKSEFYTFSSMDALLKDLGQEKEETQLAICRRIEHYADEPITEDSQYYAIIGRMPRDDKEKLTAVSYGNRGVKDTWAGDLLLMPYADKECSIWRDATYKELMKIRDNINNGIFVYTEVVLW